MHYFIEHNRLKQRQDLSDSFGVASSDPTNKFNITSQFQLDEQAKAFACQRGLMIVQPSEVDSTLVNVIVQPIDNLKVDLNNIQYFVYRGILKSSLLADDDKIAAEAPTNNEFIARFWQHYNRFETDPDSSDTEDSTAIFFGYDKDLPAGLHIEKIYDNSQGDTQAMPVKQGEWFGNFTTTHKIGFEVITSNERITIDLGYLRKERHQIDATGLTGLALRAKKEEVLSFIDPAAFWGLHYDYGINSSTYSDGKKTTETKKQEELVNAFIDPFYTKNRVYLDVRSEFGYSYNFYQNYDDGTGKNIKIGNSATEPIAQSYEISDSGWSATAIDSPMYASDNFIAESYEISDSGWPVIAIDNPMDTSNNFNDVVFQLRVDDNTNPVLFIKYSDRLTENLWIRFVSDTKLLDGASTEWSKEIRLKFPNSGSGTSKNNVAYYMKLYYYRQEANPSSPNTVISKGNSFDHLFGSLDMPYLGDTEYIFQHSMSEHPNYSKGKLSTREFGGVFNQRANFDTQRVVFTSEMSFSHKNTGTFYPETKFGKGKGIDLEGDFNQMSRLKRNILLSNRTIQEEISTATYEAVSTLGISNYDGFPGRRESLYLLGLMQSELRKLKNVTGLSDLHDRYIVFEDVSPTPAEDKDQKPYRKYKLKVQGLDENGTAITVAPTDDVFVYTTENFMLCSKAFAENEPLGDSKTYSRNYEEKIGFENRESSTNKHYEDWFIEKDSGMKVEVDGFINDLSQINNDSDFYSHVKTLVEDSAEDIWNQAVSTVQANNNANPDDRPLYWGRIKMEVALKSHPYFKGGVNNSDLDKLIELFEEKSRNYTGVDFSNAPTEAKKILITGFDPFFLNEKHPKHGAYSNIRQSNPSGCVALALHNTLTANGIGFIQTMIVPVRYTDFDSSKNSSTGQGEGIIEKYVKPWFDEVDMIITISQAGPKDYHIDVFATATRGGTTDNMNFKRLENSKSIDNSSPETIVTSLPHEFTTPPSNASFYGKYFKTLSEYTSFLGDIEISPNNSDKGNYPVAKTYYGPGGNYLSNEIFYRVAKLREEWIESKLPNIVTKATGHFHIAKLQDKSTKVDFSITETQTLLDIVRTAINNGVTGI